MKSKLTDGGRNGGCKNACDADPLRIEVDALGVC